MEKKKLKLRELIIEALASQPQLSAAKIMVWLRRKGRDYSRRAVFKELSLLKDEGTVVSDKACYSLRLAWVSSFLETAERMKATYFEAPLIRPLPSAGKRQSWKFNNLYKPNSYWSQVLVEVAKFSRTKVLYGWTHHPYYHLIETEQEKQYQETLDRLRMKQYVIVGGETFLDKWAEKFWNARLMQHSSAESPFHSWTNFHFDVIDDYIIGLTIPHDHADQIHQLYQKCRRWSDLDLSEVIQIFSRPTVARLTLENSPVKAKSIRRKFFRYFGIRDADMI